MMLTAADVQAIAAGAETTLGKIEFENTTKGQSSISKLPGINLIGPEGTQAFVNSLGHFMARGAFPIRVLEGQGQALESSSKSHPNSTSFSFRVQSFSLEELCESSTFTPKKRPRGGAQSRLSFVFTTQPVPGKFLAQKASDLGVPRGPLLGKLKRGEAVTFTNGDGAETTVHSSDVVENSTPGIAVLVLCYDDDQVAAFQSLQRQAFDMMLRDVVLELVIHVAPNPDAIGHFQANLMSKCEHVFLSTDPSHDVDGTPFQTAAMGALCRSELCSEIFLAPRNGSPVSLTGKSYVVATAMLEYVLIPRAKRGLVVPDPWQCGADEVKKILEESGALPLARQIVAGHPRDGKGSQGSLFFTGTGSAIPCKYRNVSGMALEAKNDNMMLLDCGEGTVGQLLRHRSCNNTLEPIRAVWISHPHADHHLGLLRLLHDRNSGNRLLLIAPKPILAFLEEYSQIDTSIAGKYIPVDCSEVLGPKLGEIDSAFANTQEYIQQNFEWRSILSVPVAHCPHAFAVIIDGTSFGRVVYTGDCRPSKRLAQTACPVDVLIHEATFEDGMEGEAVLKRHSTIGEALGVASEMQAKCVVLTHFSQRYPKIPPVPTTVDLSSLVIFAFDSMKLTAQNLQLASELIPALRMLFPENGSKTKRNTTAEELLATPGLFAQNKIL